MFHTKVLVIGAGPSGLASLRAVKEHDPPFYNSRNELLCLDSGSCLGGIWRPPTTESKGFIWDGMLTNLSREKCAFGGFSHEECFAEKEKILEESPYATTKEMLIYFNKFTAKFDLEKHIQLNSRVVNVDLLKGEQDNEQENNSNNNNIKYKVEYIILDAASQTKHTIITCEKIIFASGVFSVPNIPVKLQTVCQEAGVKCAHSCEIQSPQNFCSGGASSSSIKKKKVLIVGNSYSGADIAVAFSKLREQLGIEEVISTCREKGRWFMPRNLKLKSSNNNNTNGEPEEFVVDAWDRLLEKRLETHFGESDSYFNSISSHRDRHAWLKSVLPDPGETHAFLKIDTENDPAQTVICSNFLETILEGGIKLMKWFVTNPKN